MKKIFIILFLMISCAPKPVVKIKDFNFTVNENLSLFDLNKSSLQFTEGKQLKLFLKPLKKNNIDNLDVWLKFVNAPDSQKINPNDSVEIILPKPQKYNDLIGYLEFKNISNSNLTVITSQPFIIPMKPKIDSLFLDQGYYLHPEPEENRILLNTKFYADEKSLTNMQLLLLGEQDTLQLKVYRDPVTHYTYIRQEDNNQAHYKKLEKNNFDRPYLQTLEIEYSNKNSTGKFYSKPKLYFKRISDVCVDIFGDTGKFNEIDESEPIVNRAKKVVEHLFPGRPYLKYRNDYEVYEIEFPNKYSNRRTLSSYNPYEIEPPSWFWNRPKLIRELIKTIRTSKIGHHKFNNIAFIIEGSAGPNPEPITKKTRKIDQSKKFYYNEFYDLDGSQLKHQPVRYQRKKLKTVNEVNDYLATKRACNVTDILIKELKNEVNTRNRFFTTITQKYSERVVRLYIVNILKMQ